MNGQKFCVLGHNIGYSLSPVLHSAVFEFLGEKCEYFVADVSAEELESTVKRLVCECYGFNVTKPYKERVAEILGVSGPVNTVRCADKAATSTDAEGFLCDYTSVFGAPKGNVLLLGAGGAAKSVAEALESASRVRGICVYNRTYDKAQQMERGKIKAVRTAAGRYDVVINCTSLGLCGEQSAPDELDFAGVGYAYDLVYSPPETPFLAKAKAAGVKAVNGLGMLVWQAIAAHEFWRREKFTNVTKTKLAEYVKRKLTEAK